MQHWFIEQINQLLQSTCLWWEQVGTGYYYFAQQVSSIV